MPYASLAVSHMLSGRKTSISFSSVTGGRPVPKDTTMETGIASFLRLSDNNAILYSWISVIASKVGLLAIKLQLFSEKLILL